MKSGNSQFLMFAQMCFQVLVLSEHLLLSLFPLSLAATHCLQPHTLTNTAVVVPIMWFVSCFFLAWHYKVYHDSIDQFLISHFPVVPHVAADERPEAVLLHGGVPAVLLPRREPAGHAVLHRQPVLLHPALSARAGHLQLAQPGRHQGGRDTAPAQGSQDQRVF